MASNQETGKTPPIFDDNPMGGVQRITLVNEAGFYRLVLRSHMPKAELFTDWVCEIVLPRLRIMASNQESNNSLWSSFDTPNSGHAVSYFRRAESLRKLACHTCDPVKRERLIDEAERFLMREPVAADFNDDGYPF